MTRKLWIKFPHHLRKSATLALGGLLVCLITFWVLGKIVTQFFPEQIKPIETTFLLTIHQKSNPFLDQLMLMITTLGNPQTLVPVALITLSVLIWKHAYPEASIFTVLSLGAIILNMGVKSLIKNPRPQLWSQLITETSPSFPSGHALGCTVIYGTIAYLLGQHYPQKKWMIYTLTIGMVILIIFSRLYLGVHWPSDVLAGASFGFIWLMICIPLFRWQKIPKNGDKS